MIGQPYGRLVAVRDSIWDKDTQSWLIGIREEHIGGCNGRCRNRWHYLAAEHYARAIPEEMSDEHVG